MNPTNPTPSESRQTPVRYYWKQCYGMADGVYHWALCDDESQKERKVSCAYMVLLADYPTGIDGKPVGEQFMPARIIDALNSHASHLARIDALERALGKARKNEAVCHCGEAVSAHGMGSGHAPVELRELCPYAEEIVELRRILEGAANMLEHVSKHEWGGNFPASLREMITEARLALAPAAGKGEK